MAIVQNVDLHAFREAFRVAGRQDQFSWEALEALFDYLEQYSEDVGEPFELDVIAICCEWCESHWSDIAKDCRIDLTDCEDDDERIEAVRDYLNDNTMMIELYGGETFVYMAF